MTSQITLSDDQQKVVNAFGAFIVSSDQTSLVIEGHSGTGKSFVTRELLKTLDALAALPVATDLGKVSDNKAVYLTATTNTAAKVLENSCGVKSRTIYSLLGLRPQVDYSTGKETLFRVKNSKSVAPGSIVFIDEASMISRDLLQKIETVLADSKVIYIGDPYQLPPINEATPPAFDLPNKVKLTKIMRQAEGSPIAALGEGFRKVLKGEAFPTFTNCPELMLVQHDEYMQLLDKSFEGTVEEIHERSVKVLGYTNDYTIGANKYIRGKYTDSESFLVGEDVVTNKPIIAPGGMIVYTNNSEVTITGAKPITRHGMDGHLYTLENGYVGFMPTSPEPLKRLLKEAKRDKDWKTFYGLKDEILDLRPSHAMTVHKSQGGTFKTVFLNLDDISKCRSRDTAIKLLYVALTRATDKVIMTGSLPERILYG